MVQLHTTRCCEHNCEIGNNAVTNGRDAMVKLHVAVSTPVKYTKNCTGNMVKYRSARC